MDINGDLDRNRHPNPIAYGNDDTNSIVDKNANGNNGGYPYGNLGTTHHVKTPAQTLVPELDSFSGIGATDYFCNQ